MMQGVVLRGTGRKALLEGYSAGGKTGTAQQFDFAKHAYSHTKYWASFAGFAPINNPAITVVVVLDSPEGRTTLEREGGWVAAPVFQRVAQQVLEYLHTPHDVEIPESRRSLLASAKAGAKDLEAGSPDHPGEPIDTDALSASGPSEPSPSLTDQGRDPRQPANDTGIVAAAMREQMPAQREAKWPTETVSQLRAITTQVPSNGTVVLDVEQGGNTVPSFVGMSVRSAVELAEASGLDLDAVGDGIAQEQNPPAGAHIATGGQVTVRFGR